MIYLLIACRCLLALVFGVSAVSKARNRRAFGDFVLAVQRLAPRWAIRTVAFPGAGRGPRTAAVLIVSGEALVAVLLLAPGTAIAGFLLAAGMLGAFTVAIAAVLRRGDQVACRCFGASDQVLRPAHLLRNLVLLAVAATGLAAALVLPGGEPALPGAATAVAAGAFAALLVLLLDDLLDLFAPTTSRNRTRP